MNRSLNWYLDEAKKKQGFTSDRQLSLALNNTHSAVTAYRKLKAYPSVNMMMKLAEYAGVPQEIALMDLGYWTNFDNDAADVYEKLADMAVKMAGFGKASMVGAAALLASISADIEPSAHAVEPATPRVGTIYIMGNN